MYDMTHVNIANIRGKDNIDLISPMSFPHYAKT